MPPIISATKPLGPPAATTDGTSGTNTRALLAPLRALVVLVVVALSVDRVAEALALAMR